MQPRPLTENVALHAFAAARRAAALLTAGRAAIDRFHLAAGRTAANPLQRRAEGEWDKRTDRRTDGRTPDSCIDLVPHTMRVVSTSLCRSSILRPQR